MLLEIQEGRKMVENKRGEVKGTLALFTILIEFFLFPPSSQETH